MALATQLSAPKSLCAQEREQGRAAAGPALSADDAPRPQAEAAALKGEALAVAREVAEAYPDDPLAYALLGSAFYNTGQSDAAATNLHKCVQLSPRQAEAYEMLARIAYDQGKLEETERFCQEALKNGPAIPDVLTLLGRALMDGGKTESAVQALERATRLPQPAGESYYLLGQAQMQSGEFEKAKASFLAAVRLVPDHTQAFFGLYNTCLRLGQDAEARHYREQFQKWESADRQALRNRSAQEDSLSGLPLVRKTVARTIFGASQLCGAHRENEKAVAFMRRAAILDGEHPGYRAAIESHFVQRKAPEQAIAVFEQLAAEQPSNHLNHFFAGRVYARLGQWDAAERAYRKSQELGPTWSGSYRGLAELYLRANNKLPEALALAKTVVELDPAASSYYLLAVASLRSNERAGSLEAIKRAVELSPGEKRFQDFLQQLQAPPK